IVMRSLGLTGGLTIVDNSASTFAIVYYGKTLPGEIGSHYFGFTNLLISAIPSNTNSRPAQFQVYPMFDHLWRYYAPSPLWGPLNSLGRAVRRRALIVRGYLHGDLSQKYEMRIEKGHDAKLFLSDEGCNLVDAVDLWQAVRHLLDGDGFFLL